MKNDDIEFAGIDSIEYLVTFILRTFILNDGVCTSDT